MAYDKNMRILIVDDFSTMRKIIKNILRQLELTNGFEADDGNHSLGGPQSRQQSTSWFPTGTCPI